MRTPNRLPSPNSSRIISCRCDTHIVMRLVPASRNRRTMISRMDCPPSPSSALRRVMLTGTPMCLDAAVAVPGGTTVSDVVDAIRALVTRHDSLRTTYRTGDDPGADPVQVVADAGEIVLTVHETDTELTDYLLEDVRRLHWVSP